MISKKMAKAINTQINREFYSAFLYLAMANDAMDKGFKGAANWLTIQFKEEQEHAMKFAAYLQDQGAKVELAALAAPKTEWKDLLAMFQDALAHEKKVTAWICEINDLAIAEKDYATQNMLRWFIDEQVEEEASATDVIWMLEMSSGSKGALFMADKTLGKRKDD
ncbi:MAG TPA: ferritin [Kiritimatiellia bacterium]|nr:ferritin [Kiritimatiellia bacterium]HRU71610.1 ferritin [Kiritimatiellia bacterium]